MAPPDPSCTWKCRVRSEEKKKEIAEDYLAKKEEERGTGKKRKFSSIVQVKGQQEDDVYDVVYGDSNTIVGDVEEDGVYIGEA